MTNPVPPITIASPSVVVAGIAASPFVPAILPVPKSFRTPALRRLGVLVRSATTTTTTTTTVSSSSSNNNNNSGGGLVVASSPSVPIGGVVAVGGYGNTTARIMVDSTSPADGSDPLSVDKAAGAPGGGVVIDAGGETRPPVSEVDPLPKFLREPKGEMHAKFTDLEWQERQRLLEGLKAFEQQEKGETVESPWLRLKGGEVALRNRYLNVDPYANNRVRLNVPADQNDYINASPIRLPTSTGEEKRYVATQGPKENTTPHFWRMVLDSPASPVVIIMLTQTVEANREKCFQYYPLDMTSPTLPVTDPEDESFAVTVTLQSIHVDTTTQSTIRELLVQSADGTRKKKVWHLLYASWPDFLVPEGEDRLALLRLIKLSRKLAASELGGSGSGKGKTGTAATATTTTTVAAPTVKLPERLVHCSAGVGRTGTFIALDWLIDELNAGALDESALGAAGVDEGGEADKPGEDPIVDLVDRLRQQRMMMVQGEMQFGFLYEVLADLWLEIWKAKHGTE